MVASHWKDWCWNSNTLATWCEEQTHLKRPWCWERLEVGGEGDDREWDDWMASPTQWTWVWVNSGSWWWTGRTGVLWFMGLQSQTQLSNWTELGSQLCTRNSSVTTENISSFLPCFFVGCLPPSLSFCLRGIWSAFLPSPVSSKFYYIFRQRNLSFLFFFWDLSRTCP